MSVTLANLRELDCGPRSPAEAREFGVQSFRYMMFKLLVDSPDVDLKGIETKVGIDRRKACKLVLTDSDLALRDISDWCFAFGAEPDIRIIPRSYWNRDVPQEASSSR